MRNKLKLCLWAGLVAFASCSDDWDSHYDRNGSVPQTSLMDMIKADASLGKFAQVLERTGYDSLLTSTNTYTVWAPVDDALSGLDLNNMDELRRMAANHIARYSNPSSTTVGKSVYMLNGKAMSYSADGRFNETDFAEKDRVAANGVLHKMKAELPYRYNIMEYMSTHSDYSKVYGFITRFVEKQYDAAASVGKDSVFADYYKLLQHRLYGIGHIFDEDSVYTMIIPDNAAWDAAMERLKPYFVAYNKIPESADSICEVQAGQAILRGLTFHNRVTSLGEDTLLTVLRDTVPNTARYFEGYTPVEASNGQIYLANGALHMDDYHTWNQPVTVEAESDYGRSLGTKTSVYVRNTDDQSAVQGVSDFMYLEVSNTSSQASITYKVPQLLAGKYDVYIDFVPPVIDGPALATEKTRVQVRLNYPKIESASGTSYVQRKEKDDPELIIGGDGEQDNRIVSLKVWSGMEFPSANYYDPLWMMDDKNSYDVDKQARFSIQIQTNVDNSEVNTLYRRRMRIDCVRFVPVP